MGTIRTPVPEMTIEIAERIAKVGLSIFEERQRQLMKWGDQQRDNGTDAATYTPIANHHREVCDLAEAAGECTWRHVLLEEVFEAMAEVDDDALEKELIQVAAVCSSWIEDIRRRRAANGQG